MTNAESIMSEMMKEVVVEYSDKIKVNFDKIKEKYPEVMV